MSKASAKTPPLAEILSPRVFKALCDPTRLSLLCQLAESPEPCSVGRLAARSPVDLSVVSRHLATLRDAGIVEAMRRGKNVYYRVRGRPLAATLRAIADALERCAPEERNEE